MTDKATTEELAQWIDEYGKSMAKSAGDRAMLFTGEQFQQAAARLRELEADNERLTDKLAEYESQATEGRLR